MKKPGFQITHSCPVSYEVQRLQEWVIIAGYWRMFDHMGKDRIIDESVMIFCVQGKGWLWLRDEKYSIREGDLFLCPPNVVHKYGSDPDMGWEIWWCHFGGEHARNLCNAIGFSVETPIIHLSDPKPICDSFSMLLKRLEKSDNTTAIDASGLLHPLLLEIFKQVEKKTFLTTLSSFVDETSSSVEEIARRAGYSKYHFCRLFKKQTGCSPWQYVIDRKIERAKELLIGSKMSIKEIAAELKFDHPDYFAKVFREKCRVSPKQYRSSV